MPLGVPALHGVSARRADAHSPAIAIINISKGVPKAHRKGVASQVIALRPAIGTLFPTAKQPIVVLGAVGIGLFLPPAGIGFITACSVGNVTIPAVARHYAPFVAIATPR